MPRKNCLLVATLVAAVPSVAGAGSLSMTYVGDGAGRSIGVRYDATAAWDATEAPASATSAFAGARNFAVSGRTMRTFSTRLIESFGIGDTFRYAQVDPRLLPGGDPSLAPIGAMRAEFLADLYGRYWSFAANDSDPDLVAGFQLAIWEIMHENLAGTDREEVAPRLSLDIGAFRLDLADSPEAFAAYVHGNMMLMSLANGPFSSFGAMRGWTDGGVHDRLAASVVPLPAPGLLALGGLLFTGSRRRSR